MTRDLASGRALIGSISKMEKLQLRCLVNGVVFSVQIARNAKVEELKRVIMSHGIEVDATSVLKLFLTRERTRTWVQEDDNMHKLCHQASIEHTS